MAYGKATSLSWQREGLRRGTGNQGDVTRGLVTSPGLRDNGTTLRIPTNDVHPNFEKCVSYSVPGKLQSEPI